MPPIVRKDGPGIWHHVTNRGIAQRSIFETHEDVRFFLSHVARAVRNGRIEIHAFSLLTNHFHMLLLSLKGELSQAMHQIESNYSRWFNHRYQRDGPLFRTRFKSKPVVFDDYWKNVVRYIDFNAVDARLVSGSRDYPFGSAYYFCRPNRPSWLSCWAIEKIVCEEQGTESYRAEDYQAVFRTPMNLNEKELLERRYKTSAKKTDDLARLLQGPTQYTRRWLISRSACADGNEKKHALVAPATIGKLIRKNASQQPPWYVRPVKRKQNAWKILEAGLLRVGSGLRFREISLRLHCSEITASKMVRTHGKLLQTDSVYANQVSTIFNSALKKDHSSFERK